ncbi:putative cytochrome P450 [Rosa chinensis]|uniref:Putative cytochrome P450 n=1 Tax=Rosa chinensis TaxID=74649 RepID=A0A2P6P5F8_ROSCH|nr:putative cytochrome P450 [Rosa chinensis]
MNFGVQVVELALANLLYCFEWELPDGVRGDDLDMKEAAGHTVQKNVPLSLAARPALLVS